MWLCARFREVILASWVGACCWCTACKTVVTVSEQNRAERRGGICACVGSRVRMLEGVCGWACIRASVYSCVAEHSGTSAAVTSLSCWERRALSQPGNAWSQPKRSPPLSFPLFFLPYVLSLPSESHMELQLAAGLDWAWKHTSVQWPRNYFYCRAQESTMCTAFMIPARVFLWMLDKHTPSASLAPSWNSRKTEVRHTKQPGGNG